MSRVRYTILNTLHFVFGIEHKFTIHTVLVVKNDQVGEYIYA